MPLPRSVNTGPAGCPVWMWSYSSPDSVGTYRVVPSAALGIGRFSTCTRSVPSRMKIVLRTSSHLTLQVARRAEHARRRDLGRSGGTRMLVRYTRRDPADGQLAGSRTAARDRRTAGRGSG